MPSLVVLTVLLCYRRCYYHRVGMNAYTIYSALSELPGRNMLTSSTVFRDQGIGIIGPKVAVNSRA